jgi:hypothetical protein
LRRCRFEQRRLRRNQHVLLSRYVL